MTLLPSSIGRAWPENTTLWGANVSAGLTAHGMEQGC